MDPDYVPTQFNVFLEEVNGQSRDRPSRLAIEVKVRALFEDIDNSCWRDVRSYFHENARFIISLESPRYIIDKNLDEVIRWFKSYYAEHHAIVPTLVLVDRGRVTCHLTNFSATLPDDETPKFEHFTEYHEIIILDLDENHRITRFERRKHTKTETEHRGDIWEFKDLVQITKRKSFEMKEYFY